MENEDNVTLTGQEILQRHETLLADLGQRFLDLERRLATLETDMRELEFGVRNSLDEIRKGMSGMITFMEQFKRPQQPPISGAMN